MTILSIESISKQYGERPLFSEVSFGMARGDRIGVIGVNGSGKTSLLRIVAGIEPPDGGRVVLANGVHVAYLPQAPQLDDNQTVLEAVFAGDSPTMRLIRRYEQLSAAIAEQPDDQALLDQLSALTPQLDNLGAWEAETAAHTIITELGIQAVVSERVGNLSGGQRKRVAMARALVDRPDLLILDEPTNHIDTDTVAWIEEYLARTPCALLLVTHDRYFLERLVTRMVELDRGKIYAYEGNYERFLEQKAERQIQAEAAEEARRNLLRRELAWLRRGARARTTKQKSHVERVYDLMEQRPEAAQGTVSIDVGMGRRIGKRVLELRGIGKGYGGRTLIRGLSLELQPNDRVGIIGPNGSGKSTLLNILAGRIQPDQGELIVGETVHMAYYDQESSGLNEQQRVVDFIREAAELVRGRDGALMAATQMLERFLFTPEQQWAYISTLSGGERRRLALLRQLIERPNVLLLDEPTNDLDLQTLSVLEDYLDEFQGAVVAVSHDRYFLDRVAQRTLAFEGDGRISVYPGGYTLYTQYRPAKPAPETKPRPTAKPQAKPAGPQPLSGKEKRELAALEQRIAELEARRDTIGAELNGAGGDYTRYNQLAADLAATEAAIEAAFERWAELSERA